MEKIDVKYAIRDFSVKNFSFLHDVRMCCSLQWTTRIIAYGDEGYYLNLCYFQGAALAEIKRENGRTVWAAANLDVRAHC